MARVEFKWVLVERPMHPTESQFVFACSTDRYNTVMAALKAAKEYIDDPESLDFDIADSSGFDLDIERYIVSNGLNSKKECKDPKQHTRIGYNYVIVHVDSENGQKVCN